MVKYFMTPEERKRKVNELRLEHQDYFDSIEKPDALFIPKMAYRPKGKDDLHISFFPSEMKKGQDIYTEFVSIQYESEDPKRTLYLLKENPFFAEEYELSMSNAGFERYLVPVSELKVINDVTSRTPSLDKEEILPLPDPDKMYSAIGAIDALHRIADCLEDITDLLNKKLK